MKLRQPFLHKIIPIFCALLLTSCSAGEPQPPVSSPFSSTAVSSEESPTSSSEAKESVVASSSVPVEATLLPAAKERYHPWKVYFENNSTVKLVRKQDIENELERDDIEEVEYIESYYSIPARELSLEKSRSFPRALGYQDSFPYEVMQYNEAKVDLFYQEGDPVEIRLAHGGVNFYSFSPDYKMLVYNSYESEGHVYLHDVETGEETLLDYINTTDPVLASTPVARAEFLSNDYLLVALDAYDETGEYLGWARYVVDAKTFELVENNMERGNRVVSRSRQGDKAVLLFTATGMQPLEPQDKSMVTLDFMPQGIVFHKVEPPSHDVLPSLYAFSDSGEFFAVVYSPDAEGLRQIAVYETGAFRTVYSFSVSNDTIDFSARFGEGPAALVAVSDDGNSVVLQDDEQSYLFTAIK